MGTPKINSADPSSIDMPAPDPGAAALSARLCALIRKEIETSGGSIPFSRFMELALYAPGLGYYVAGARKFGAAGDFITAPELGDLFAKCLARQCAQVLETCGGDIVEFGAGSGALAAELLTALAEMQCLPERYRILELSPELRQRQHAAIANKDPQLLSRTQWLDRMPESITGVIIANEVLDAMPVQRFRVADDEVHELAVGWDGHRFIEMHLTASPADAQYVQDLGLPAGYICETHARACAWLASIAHGLEQGVVLIADYGFPAREYYHPQRGQGTLMCHYRHRVNPDPYQYVGLQDITAHLDFTALANTGRAHALDLLGYTQQAAFLMSLGLPELASLDTRTDERERMGITQQIQTLTSPAEMGELFKVMALGRGVNIPLRGFQLSNHRERL